MQIYRGRGTYRQTKRGREALRAQADRGKGERTKDGQTNRGEMKQKRRDRQTDRQSERGRNSNWHTYSWRETDSGLEADGQTYRGIVICSWSFP